MVVNNVATNGVSPKVLNAGITAVVLFLLSLLTSAGQTNEQLVNVVLPIVVAYFSKPGDVVVDQRTTPPNPPETPPAA